MSRTAIAVCRTCDLPIRVVFGEDGEVEKVFAVCLHVYREFRDDGWPLCPQCGEDELWSPASPATIETISGCYRCDWKAPP